MENLRIDASDFEAVVRKLKLRGSDVVGRRSEKSALYGWTDRISAGQKGSILFLAGPTGSGKTRLSLAAGSRVRRRGYVVCSGTCDPMRGPFAPFVEAIQNAMAGALPPDVDRRLKACLKGRPDLSELVGWPSSYGSGVPHEPVNQHALFQALAHALILLSENNPALLIVEDLHLADDATRKFLAYLAARIRMHRLLVLAACRTDEDGKLPDHLRTFLKQLDGRYGIFRIDLGGLNAPETDALIRSAYRRNLFSEALRQGIHRATGGNPSAILEALRLFEAQGIIFKEDGIWKENRASALDIPSELYEAIAIRLENLSPDTVRFLRLAAACGNRFDPEAIERAMGLNKIRLLKILGPLVRTCGVMVQEGTRYTFASSRLRDILYERTPADIRQDLHLALGKALEAIYAGKLENLHLQEVLAEHYYKGGDYSKALPFLVAAGDRACKFWSGNRAVDYYGQALNALDKTDPEGENDDLRMQLLQRAAGAHIRLKQWDQANARLQVLLDLSVQRADRRAEAETWKGIGRICAGRKAFARALAFYRRSLLLFREVKDASGECDVLVKAGRIYLDQGRWQDLQKVYRRAFLIARGLQNDAQIASISMNMAIMYNIQGEASKAIHAYHRCLKIYRRQGLWDNVTAALLNIGKCLADCAHYVDAKRYYTASLKVARRRYDVLHEAIVHLNLSEILLAEGNLQPCEAMCERARARFEEIDHRMGLADAFRILACVSWRREDSAQAEIRFRKSIAINQAVGYRLGEAESCRDYARFLQSGPHPEHANPMFARAREIFLNLGVKREVERIDRIMSTPAGLARGEGHPYPHAV